MLLFIVRHGEPIYGPDTLTPKGKLQAQAAAKRLAVHGLDKIFSSPLGRAKETAQPSCELMNLPCEIEDWMSENTAWDALSSVDEKGVRRWVFHHPGRTAVFKNSDNLNLGADWHTADCYDGIDAKAGYQRICDASDDFFARLGFERIEGSGIYKVNEPKFKRVAAFCHQGFGLTWISHILGIPPHVFWSSFDITHSGVTIIKFSESRPECAPICLSLSDTSHIYGDRLPMKYNNYIDI